MDGLIQCDRSVFTVSINFIRLTERITLYVGKLIQCPISFFLLQWTRAVLKSLSKKLAVIKIVIYPQPDHCQIISSMIGIPALITSADNELTGKTGVCIYLR